MSDNEPSSGKQVATQEGFGFFQNWKPGHFVAVIGFLWAIVGLLGAVWSTITTDIGDVRSQVAALNTEFKGAATAAGSVASLLNRAPTLEKNIQETHDMNPKRAAGASEWTDPDDAPELDDGFFDRAEIRAGERLIRRGRPPPATRSSSFPDETPERAAVIRTK